MTNYFVNCVYIQICAHIPHCDDAKRGPSWLCTEAFMATHSLTSTISAASSWTSLKTPVCVLRSRQWGFSSEIHNKLTYFWCICHHCYALFELLRLFTISFLLAIWLILFPNIFSYIFREWQVAQGGIWVVYIQNKLYPASSPEIKRKVQHKT